jgi:hypothetical protein
MIRIRGIWFTKITRLRLNEELDSVNRLLWDTSYSIHLTEDDQAEDLKKTQLVMTYHKNWGYSLLNYDGSGAYLEKSTAREMFLFLKGMGHILYMKSA